MIITKDNREEVIKYCLEEADRILNEANLSMATKKATFKVWIDSAGIDRKNPDNEPRIKVDTNTHKQVPFYIPKKVGEKSYILAKRIAAEQNNKTKRIRGLKYIYNFILEYNDILLTCYYLNSPIFNNPLSNDKIIRNVLDTISSYNRDEAFKIISKKYHVPVNEIIPEDLKKLANNF